MKRLGCEAGHHCRIRPGLRYTKACHSERSEESAFVLENSGGRNFRIRDDSPAIRTPHSLRSTHCGVILNAVKDLHLLLHGAESRYFRIGNHPGGTSHPHASV
jgi:hypothetical protein